MTNSHRRTPIIGHTLCASEKDDKVRAHRIERRLIKSAIRSGEEIPHSKAFGNPWSAGKDGKHWVGDRRPELMRK